MNFASRIRHWLPLLPLLALLAATYWLNQQVLPASTQPEKNATIPMQSWKIFPRPI
jgi:Ni,Fe-hydrogenase I cytochrome b subunit